MNFHQRLECSLPFLEHKVFSPLRFLCKVCKLRWRNVQRLQQYVFFSNNVIFKPMPLLALLYLVLRMRRCAGHTSLYCDLIFRGETTADDKSINITRPRCCVVLQVDGKKIGDTYVLFHKCFQLKHKCPATCKHKENSVGAHSLVHSW